jgi:hypothetical protein
MKRTLRRSKVLPKGITHKIVEISGTSYTHILRYQCNSEIMLVISEGNIGLEIGCSTHLLKQPDYILIPAQQSYAVIGLSTFKVLLVMPFNSRLMSINKNSYYDNNYRKNNRRNCG